MIEIMEIKMREIMEKIGGKIWEGSPEGGVVIFGIIVLIIIWIIFYRKI